MKYETPVMEFKETEEHDIIKTSGLTGEAGGDGPSINPTSLTGNEDF